ncbi:SLC25A17, partial [Symbiodinium microadriaticum]
HAALSASRESRVEKRAPKGVFATVHQLWLEEGARSLWRGLGTSLWLVANPVIQFFAYDFLKALHVKTAEISALEATAETLNPKTLKP